MVVACKGLKKHVVISHRKESFSRPTKSTTIKCGSTLLFLCSEWYMTTASYAKSCLMMICLQLGEKEESTLNDNSCVCFDQHLIVVVVSKPSESLLYQCRVKTLINHFGERTGTSKQSGFLNFP